MNTVPPLETCRIPFKGPTWSQRFPLCAGASVLSNIQCRRIKKSGYDLRAFKRVHISPN